MCSICWGQDPGISNGTTGGTLRITDLQATAGVTVTIDPPAEDAE